MIVFAREPIFDLQQRLFAYQLVFRDGEQGALPEDFSTAHIDSDGNTGLISNTEKREQARDADTTGAGSIGLNELLSGFTSVVSVSKHSIEQGLPEDFTPQDTILEIDNFDESDLDFISTLKSLRSAGFRIALHNRQSLSLVSLTLADYLKIDTNKISLKEFERLRLTAAEHNIQTIATKVSDAEQYRRCVNAGFHYFQGYFFLRRAHNDSDDLPANKLSLLQLLAQTADDSIDMDAIRTTFEHDATLSYLLMRFINNPLINKSHKITSIKHALTYLGEVMLRKFAAIISIAQLNQDNVNELLQVSLVRAKYCEILQGDSDNKQDAMSAFMTGLFSLIDVILDRDMESLLTQIQISSDIQQALVAHEGRFFPMIGSIRALESSSWLQFKAFAKDLSLEEETLQSYYIEAVKWNNALQQGDSDMFPRAKPQG